MNELEEILEETRHEAVFASDPANLRKVTNGIWRGKQMRSKSSAHQAIKGLILELIDNTTADASSLAVGPMISKDKLKEKVENL